mmetsp:Transcript_10810/g.19738  ORF Transcript_10810/g.19738 Transcript_10810/m.19738 type:complete len:401 (+) Transcript_10810:168-1370(+)|eukprot:CAMPEP_0197528214 /NCGR_PEP_ID=MMETSP1318-20131121/24318_1 /TAXON_ID=552666 /ORGANISM="Partenskyella glossopodia, Strain RCC365" /LENGTH=400 /DNA_ID=CAMNT_0043083213 /DNA_START=89 /DNA_END=1291 /DNA_ORIENTATION=+
MVKEYKTEEEGEILLEAKNVYMRYPLTGELALRGASLKVIAGRIRGLIGKNEAGKSSLARAFCGKYPAERGKVYVRGQSIYTQKTPGWVWGMYVVTFAALVSTVMGISEAVQQSQYSEKLKEIFNGSYKNTGNTMLLAVTLAMLQTLTEVVGMRILPVLLLFAACAIEIGYRSFRHFERLKFARERIAFITSEDSPGTKFPEKMSIRNVVCQHMPKTMSGEERRQRATCLLKSAGLQLYDANGKAWGSAEEYVNEDVKMERCSGGQKHLVYVMSELAKDPKIIIADEILVGLDVPTRARVIVMLQHMVSNRGAGVLYISTDITPMDFVTKEIAFMEDGKIIELSDSTHLIHNPSQKQTKAYMKAALDPRMMMLRHAASLREEVAKAIPKIKDVIRQAFSG